MSSINEFRCTSRTIHLVPYVRLPAVSIGAAGGQLPGDSPTIFAAGEINFPNFFGAAAEEEEEERFFFPFFC